MPVGPELWQAALAQGAEQPSKSWIAALDLVEAGESTLTLRVRPGQRNLLGFLRRKQDELEQLLADLAGRGVKVRIEAPASDEAEPADHRPGGRRGLSQQQKNEAMNLPLVRQVAQLFDASLIDVQEIRPASGEVEDSDDSEQAE